jgi:hypothetical protein
MLRYDVWDEKGESVTCGRRRQKLQEKETQDCLRGWHVIERREKLGIMPLQLVPEVVSMRYGGGNLPLSQKGKA